MATFLFFFSEYILEPWNKTIFWLTVKSGSDQGSNFYASQTGGTQNYFKVYLSLLFILAIVK